MRCESPFVFRDIRVDIAENTLTIANAAIRRTFDLALGMPRTVSLQDAAGREFARHDKTCGDFSFIGINRPGVHASDYHVMDVSAEAYPDSLLDSEHVRVSLQIEETVQKVRFTRQYIIYPALPAIAVRTSVCATVMPNLYWSRRLPDSANATRFPVEHLESCADSINPALGLAPTLAIEFCARTDYTDERVQVHRAEDGQLSGNLLFCEDADGAGFAYLQEAPPSSERRDFERYDFRVADGTVFSCTWGIEPHELEPARTFTGYRHALILYENAAERDRLIKVYLKRRFPINPEKNHSIMVNPWGCGKFPRLVSEPFLLAEIKASAEAGATHYQIDDSWQAGNSLAELSINNRAVGRSFWDVSDRLGGSFDPLVKAAAAAGIELALWLAPSSNRDYRDWEDCCHLVLDYHRRCGFGNFKIDAVLIRTYEAEENLRKLLQTAREKSDGNIYFNLDTTNGQRPGYFLFLEYGNIFLENRYVCHPGGMGYHPEKTLRGLWKLARYIRPQSLQIGIPSPGDLLDTFYDERKLLSPRVYPVEYWAAIALFANPLLWFAPSTVAAADRSRIRRIMDVHLRHRNRIFAGEIFPIGSCPDGRSIAGLQSHDFQNGSGYVIFYREYASAVAHLDVAVNYLPDQVAIERIAGDAELTHRGGKVLNVAIPTPATYALFRYQPC